MIDGKKMLEQLSEHIWYMPHDDETDRPALGYVLGEKTSLMVDSGNSPDHISHFYGLVRSMGMPDPNWVVLTHWHWDHVFGLSGSPAKSIAHVLTNERLQIMQRWDWSDNSLSARLATGAEIQFAADMIRKEMPTRHSFKVKQTDFSFEVQCNIRLDDIECQLIHVGGPHSVDSIVVYVPQEKVLFLGDCNNIDLYNSGSMRLSELSSLIVRLDQYDAEWFVPSHREPVHKADFMTELYALEKIGRAVGMTTDMALVPDLLKKELKHQPDENELEAAKPFVIANGLAEKNLTDHQFLYK